MKFCTGVASPSPLKNILPSLTKRFFRGKKRPTFNNTNLIMSSTNVPTISMEELDSRTFPIPYTLSKLRLQIAEKIATLLEKELDTKTTMPQTPTLSSDIIYQMLERPKNPSHGEFAVPIPQIISRLLGDINPRPNPIMLAKSLATLFPRDDLIFKGIIATGPFLNISIHREYLFKNIIQSSLSLSSSYGHNQIGKGRTVMVEFSSPNIAKPFHAGHLRSTVIGNFISHLYKANGFETKTMNYLGDWGKQYGLLAIGFKRFGNEEALLEDPIKHLFDVYVRINAEMKNDPSIDDEAREYFCRMEKNEPEAMKLWKRFRELSISKYRKIYDRLNVSFDIYSGESQFEEAMIERLQELKDSSLLQESNGAQVIDLEGEGEGEGGLGKAILLKRDGTTIYLTRDVASAHQRFEEHKLDKAIYVISSQQDHHMKQLIAVMKRMGRPFYKNMLHVNFGMVMGMSTRKGNVVFLEDILDEAKDVMHEVMLSNPAKYAQIPNPLEVADTLAVSAIVIQDMAARRCKDYEFKLERVTRFEGDTGPYLQYAHARLCSLERKYLDSMGRDDNEIDFSTFDASLLKEEEAFQLLMQIGSFPDCVQETRMSLEPCSIVHYLLQTSKCISIALEKLWVQGQPDPAVVLARLALYRSARQVLCSGLMILGLKPLERM